MWNLNTVKTWSFSLEVHGQASEDRWMHGYGFVGMCTPAVLGTVRMAFIRFSNQSLISKAVSSAFLWPILQERKLRLREMK